MPDTDLVRPGLRGFLQAYPIATMDAARLRTIRANPFPLPPPAEIPGVRMEERHIPGAEGQPAVRVLLYRPDAPRGGGIVQIHGGGYVLGAPESDDAGNRALCAGLGAVVVAVDYRLAPEHPYPAALDDCFAALAWLHAEAASLGVDPARIALKGESAGGGIAAGLALMARDRGKNPIAFQCLTYPMLDDRPPADPHPHTGAHVWTAPSNRFAWDCYLGAGTDDAAVPGYAAPARAAALAGLPPTLIVTGGLDLVLEEDLDYARRLTRAGVAVELIVYPGVYHGFQMGGDAALNRRYERDVTEALREALAA